MNDAHLPPTVYLVEDSPILLERLVAAVKAAGGEVIGQSKAAEEAIATLALLRPDVIILDVRLQTGTGFDVLRALQFTGCAQSAVKIVLTSHSHEAFRAMSFELGAHGFFDKLSEIDDALDVIRKLVQSRSAAERSQEQNGDPSLRRNESDGLASGGQS